jgi:hypothetical protein
VYFARVPSLRDLFPALYHPLLPALFDQPRPLERKATCDHCVMCPPSEGKALEGVAYFRPDTKCCTYHPRVPNYLVGGLLADDDPAIQEGRRRMRARIESRIAVIPHNVGPPRKHEVLRMASWRSTMGRSLMLRCPFYEAEAGNCTVWKYREIECTAFFCKHETGADGQAFWKALREYAVNVERRLVAHALHTVMPEYSEPPSDGMTLEELEDRAPDPKLYSALWQGWEGREEAFYIACHEVVTGLSREDHERIVGGEGHEARSAEMLDRYRAVMSPALPERLVRNPAMEMRPVEGGVLTETYSRYEPLVLTEALHELIGELRADETVSEMRARLGRDAGVDVPEEILLGLYQMRVLIPAPP